MRRDREEKVTITNGKDKKIKIITGQFETTFEHQVNGFLADHPNIVGIQYQYGGPTGIFSAMIIYEE